MNRLDQIKSINQLLLEDQPQYKEDAAHFGQDTESQRRLMRSLMNVRHPRALPERYVRLQDELLSAEREERGVVRLADIPSTADDPRIRLWQGDITRLAADAIVNAANAGMLGCFVPCHSCIDNAIHSAAGLQLREECAAIMRRQGHEEPTGQAKITAGYNIPAKHVIHTVGPIIRGPLTAEDERLLASCYRSCLELAAENGLASIAFCSISTGEFHFPKQRAAEIAVQTVKNFLRGDTRIQTVVFDVFSDSSREIYRKLLGEEGES